jgi:death on curing protein
MPFIYFTVEYAIKTHDKIIEISGGLPGIKDWGNIESPLEHIQNDNYYPELENKITHLVYSIIMNHAFNDGNKRSSIALGAFFLEVNGLDFKVTKFITAMENIVVHVANNRIDKDVLFEIIQSIVYEDDFSEDLKLRILHAIS